MDSLFSSGFLQDWKGDRKGGTCAHLALDLNIAAMIFYKAIANRQSETDALYAVFGGEKAVKDLFDVLFFDTRTGISYFDFNILMVCCRRHTQGAAIGHGVPGVGHQIQKNLPQLIF